MMELANLALFVEAIGQGSLSAAGRRLGLTPVAASRRLIALEAGLGVRLVHRTTRSLSLTPEGEAFLPHAEAILAHAAEGRAAVAPGDAVAQGLLRITTSGPFGRKVLTPMLARFLGRHPRLRAELRLSDAVLDLAAEGIDLALRIGALRENRLIGKRVAANPRGLYAAPSYLAQAGMPDTMADLHRHQCLTTPGTTHLEFARAGRTVRQAVRGKFTADSVEALHQASLEGLGIVMLSRWNVATDLDAGRLVQITLADAIVPDHGIWAVYPTSRMVAPKVRLFIEALTDHLRTP